MVHLDESKSLNISGFRICGWACRIGFRLQIFFTGAVRLMGDKNYTKKFQRSKTTDEPYFKEVLAQTYSSNLETILLFKRHAINGKSFHAGAV